MVERLIPLIFGGRIADYPDAPRRWPDGPLSGDEPREVKVVLASFGGVLSYANHWYVDVTEEHNDIWDGEQWRDCWDDREGKGQSFHERFESKSEARGWALDIVKKHFPDHELQEMYEGELDWIRMARLGLRREGD